MAVVGDVKKKCSLDDALEATGFGKYNIMLLSSCCCLIVAMYIDIFGFSVLMPAVACDLVLTTAQQGLLSAVPLIGVMISSYAWGLRADTLGRRTTLLLAMPIGIALNLAASLAPNYWSLAVVKFLSGAFTSSANAAGFVLLGESVPQRFRSRMMFLMATATMLSQSIIGLLAIPIFKLSFRIEWLGLEYRPWRLLMQIICIPGALGCLLCALFTKESPKFLLSKDRSDDTMRVLEAMYSINTGNNKATFPVSKVHLDNATDMANTNTESLLRKMWNQTAPLFKPPLLKNSLMLYYLLLCAYMTSTGFTMWVPTMTNAYFNGNDATGKTFCQVASNSIASKNSTTTTDCDNTIDVNAIYATIVYSISPGLLTILLSFLVGPLGKKKTTHLVFIVSFSCGFALLFVKIPLLSIGLFYMFLYASLILGNVNTYLVELNPTHLRGMATCLSVVVARGFGFMSVQLIAISVADYCVPMISCYVFLVATGLVVSFFLPTDSKKTTVHDENKNTQDANKIDREFKNV